MASGRRLLATGVVTVANWVLGGFFQADLPITVALLEIRERHEHGKFEVGTDTSPLAGLCQLF